MFLSHDIFVTCIGDYINAIKQYQTGALKWYRGHANKDWELIPKIQRIYPYEGEKLFREERLLTNDFQTYATPLQSINLPMDDYPGWLTLMQHYGLPTRLLDWSRSPLVALYFAVSEEKEETQDACIWILVPGSLNGLERLQKPTYINGVKTENVFMYNTSHKTISTMIYPAFRDWRVSKKRREVTPDDKKFDYHMKKLSGKIAAFYPVISDGRVCNQFSAFTVHNTANKLVDVCDEQTLCRLIIPCEAKKGLLDELTICGITESYIFPDLEHLSSELCSREKKRKQLVPSKN